MTVNLAFRPDIPNQEELCLKALAKLLNNPAKHVDVFGLMEKSKLKELANCATIDEVAEISPMVAKTIILKVEEKVDRSRREKQRRAINRGNNRQRYLPSALIEHIEAEDKLGNTITRFKGEIRLESAGLLAMMQHHYHGDTRLPVAVSMVNMLPADDDLGVKHRPIGAAHLDNMDNLKLTVSGERVVWFEEAPSFQWLKKCFPKGIDFRSYNHSLKAPLIPGGYLPDVEVVLTNLFVKKPVAVAPTLVVAAMQKLSVEDIHTELTRGMKTYVTLVEDDEGKVKKKRHNYKWLLFEDAKAIKATIDEGDFADIMEHLSAYDLEHLMEGHGRMFIDVPAQDDGSGRIHPDHPHAKEIVALYGYVPTQIRAMDLFGIFAKGILVFDETALDEDGKPAILVSWKQVKGKWKKLAAKRAGEGKSIKVKMHIGLLRAWDRRRTMSGCFELAENYGVEVDWDTPMDTAAMLAESIRKDVFSLTEDAMKELGADGINGLLASISKDDVGISLITKLIAKAHEAQIKFDPMSVDRLREAMEQKLQRRLWTIAQGGGINGLQEVIVIDASLRRGECVTAAYRPGTHIAAYRFPMVLAQGLKTLRVVTPRPHNVVKGKVPPNTIYLNPEDVLDMQGDDDGDIVATTSDPRALRLFDSKIDSNRYAIEPAGQKLDFLIGSREATLYVRGNPMGQVGIMTIHRSKLLAVGDVFGALAVAVLIQEAIDKAKRHVIWSDWTRAVNLDNWKLIDGVYHLHYEGSENYLRDRCGDKIMSTFAGIEVFEETDGDMPLKAIGKWVSSRLQKFGCNTAEDQYPIGWRKQDGERKVDGRLVTVELNKRISPTLWAPARSKQGGYNGGNLVHDIHDHALKCWTDIQDEFKGEGHGDVRALLVELLGHHGHSVTPTLMDWSEYQQVRSLAGITEYSKAMQRAMSMESYNEDGTDNSSKFAEIDRAYELLRARLKEFAEMQGIQGLVDIWWMETTPHWRWETRDGGSGYTSNPEDYNLKNAYASYKVNNPNHAINAVAWAGSPVLHALGITTESECAYLSAAALKKIADAAVKRDDAFEWLSSKIWADESKVPEGVRTHMRVTGKPMYECPHCREQLQTAVVRGIRRTRRHETKAFLGKLCYALNSAGKYSKNGGAKEMGIDVRDILNMSQDELKSHFDALDGATDKVSRTERRMIQRRMQS